MRAFLRDPEAAVESAYAKLVGHRGGRSGGPGTTIVVVEAI